ncbi:MAG: pilus assembly protein [Acidimicrobiia bacterium]|nr:pilus assembly protein [Acidimicrobiia bacterium]
MHRKDDGAALVEFALVATVLFTLLFGIIEFGLAFRDWLSITSSTREGARVASAAGQDPLADCFILNSMTGPLLAVPIEDLSNNFRVTIYKADALGNPTAEKQVYIPDTTGGALDPLSCNDSWDRIQNDYKPEDRGVAANDLDTIGVRIDFTHQWITGLLPGSPNWTDDAIMRMEPRSFSGP